MTTNMFIDVCVGLLTDHQFKKRSKKRCNKLMAATNLGPTDKNRLKRPLQSPRLLSIPILSISTPVLMGSLQMPTRLSLTLQTKAHLTLIRLSQRIRLRRAVLSHTVIRQSRTLTNIIVVVVVVDTIARPTM